MQLKFLRSKVYLLICFLALFFFSWQVWRLQEKKTNPEFTKLKQELAQAQEQNKKLANLKEYFGADIYLERQAREKFKMQKSDEKVIIIQEIQGPKLKITPEKNYPNIIKWWKWLFK